MSKNKSNIQYNIHNMVVVIIFMIAILLIGYLALDNKTYKNYEKKLVNNAKEYIKKHSELINKDIFIPAKRINIIVPDNCKDTSGVIYQNGEYKPYLLCSDYESKIIYNSSDSIILNGKEIEFILSGTDYYDDDYISNEDVLVKGNVLSDEGIYELEYITGTNQSVKRLVIVLNRDEFGSIFPTISLNGDSVVTIKINEPYYEKGAYAYDSLEGDLKEMIQVAGSVDVSREGEYRLYYIVTNSKGYTSCCMRVVYIVA